MIKRASLVLILVLALPALASAERQSADTSITVTFGDKKFVNTFEVSWNTEKVYRPYGYGYIDDEWNDYITVWTSPQMESSSSRLIKAPFVFRILDAIFIDDSIIIEFDTTIDGATQHGFMRNSHETTSLQYKEHGGILDENALKPVGMFLIPKEVRFYLCCYPNFYAESSLFDGAWELNADAHLEYVEKYGDWYKTADGTWFSNPAFRELTAEEIDRLYGKDNPILYRYGDTNPKIGEVQQKLGLPVTCQLDDTTYNKLRFFQLRNDLTIFGSIDQNTLDFLGL